MCEGGGDPRTLASRRHCQLQVVAATAGVIRGGRSGLLAGLMDNAFCGASAYSSTTGYRMFAFQSNNAV